MRRLAVGGLVGPAAFVTAWAVLGTRIDGYDPMQDAISRLAADGAPDQALMTAGFVTYGLGLALFAVPLREGLAGRAWMTAAATGAAALGVAALPLDGWAGDAPHNAAAALGYLTLAATPLLAAGPLAALGHRRWAARSRLAGALSGLCLVATTVDEASGFFQRAGLTIGDAWIVACAVILLWGPAGRERPA
jgi:hypothetical membrane protein